MKTGNIIKSIGSDYQNILKAVFAGLMFYLAFPDNNIFLLAFTGFVPLLLIAEECSYRTIYLYSLIAGMILVCGSYSWLRYLARVFVGIPFPLDSVFWLLNGFYISQVFCLIFLAYAYARKKTAVPDVVLFPVIVVSIWSFFPNLFFFNLANSVSGFLPVLQASEFTGVFGVDFMVALVNITILKGIQFYRRREGGRWLSLALLVIAGWFSYGVCSLQQWDREIETWQVKQIGIIQPNRASFLTGDPLEKGDTLEVPLEMEMSRKVIEKGAEIVIWPEGHFRAFVNDSLVRKSYLNFVSETGVPLILHDTPVFFKNQKPIYRNSSIWIKKDGKYGGIYHKRFLVPFGEYVPFFNRFEGLVESFDLSNLTPGSRVQVFDTAGMKIMPLICYEIQFSNFAAESVRENPAGAVILTQSNDGWYGKEGQSEQHRSSNALRAVENRVPVIHVINNGRSSVVLPSGRVVYLSESWKQSAEVAQLPYNRKSGGSFYSRYTGLFLNTVRFFALLFLILLAVTDRWIGRLLNRLRHLLKA